MPKYTTKTSLPRLVALPPAPDYMEVEEYIGLSMLTIIEKHPIHGIESLSESISILEIRLENATLSCVCEQGVCKEAYLFED